MYSLDNEFVDSHGLVNSRVGEVNAENSILWTVELFFLMREKGEDTLLIESILNTAIKNMKIGYGLYKQNPSYLHPKEDPSKEAYLSHDQLSAILSYAKVIGNQKIIEEVMDIMKDQWLLIYDNKDPESPSINRIMHPQDISYYYLLSNKINSKVLGLVLYPILLLATIYTFMGNEKCRNEVCVPKTDREILYYIKQSTCPWIFSPINWLCQLRIKNRFGGWKNVWSTYFKDKQHPINKINNE